MEPTARNMKFLLETKLFQGQHFKKEITECVFDLILIVCYRGPQLLEVDPSSAKTVDIAGIVTDKKNIPAPLGSQRSKKNIPERENSENFVDDPDVPPLM